MASHIYALTPGSITIDANVDEVSVFINNKLYGVASGPATIEDLTPATYQITVTKMNYQKYDEIIVLTSGENKHLKINLQMINPSQPSNMTGSGLTEAQKIRLREAGSALKSYATLYYVGFSLQVLGCGGIVISAGSSSMDLSTRESIIYSSLGLIVIGWICGLIAPSKVGKAGRLLEDIAIKEKNNSILANLKGGYDNNTYNMSYTYHF